jgi:nucleoside-diphosphate-sugar epimerase
MLAGIVGAPAPKIKTIPPMVVRLAGLFVPFLRELEEVRYQFDRPFVVDSTAFEETFGVRATPMDHALAATVAWWREQRRTIATR